MREFNNDIADAFLYPRYERLARYIPSSITPNQLTLASFLFGVSASAVLIAVPGNIKFLFSSLFLYLWSLFDALDGIHARAHKKSSQFGAFLDHFVDAICVLCLYSSILYVFQIQQIVFILTLGFRLLMSITTFILSSYTNELFLPKIGPTCEQFLFIFFLVLSFIFPGNVIGFDSRLLILHEISGMNGISIMGLAMFILFLITPLTVFEHFSIARKVLTKADLKSPTR